jgi:hypothetical protein
MFSEMALLGLDRRQVWGIVHIPDPWVRRSLYMRALSGTKRKRDRRRAQGQITIRRVLFSQTSKIIMRVRVSGQDLFSSLFSSSLLFSGLARFPNFREPA